MELDGIPIACLFVFFFPKNSSSDKCFFKKNTYSTRKGYIGVSHPNSSKEISFWMLEFLMICIPSMYHIPTFYYKNQPNVGKYTIHGWYGTCLGQDIFNNAMHLLSTISILPQFCRWNNDCSGCFLLCIKLSQTTKNDAYCWLRFHKNRFIQLRSNTSKKQIPLSFPAKVWDSSEIRYKNKIYPDVSNVLSKSNLSSARNPVIFSDDNWGVQSPPKCMVFRSHYHSWGVIGSPGFQRYYFTHLL